MLKTKRFDIVDYLKTEKDIEEYLNAVLEEKDYAFLPVALADIARARKAFSYTPPPFPSIEELKAEARQKTAERLAEWEKTGVDPLAKYAGCLKGVYPEDAVQYQRELRDEWPD
ncbi:MAG: hypothetical protein LBT00_01765 [Spirochaetaceae bacterium]|jgi:hypothetical protein|nr:hypothetical protein [Spirochaetaceae bacterium]